MPLCKAWRGLRADDLRKFGPEFHDMEFVHHAGFIGGAWSLPTVLIMAQRSLEEAKPNEDVAIKE